MSGPAGSQHWMYASGGFYPFSIDQSLRYNSADTLAMKRTPSSAGNRQTWSVSIWLKRGKLGVSQVQLLEAGSSGDYSSRLFWYFDSNDKLRLSDGNTNYGGGNQVFRDVGAWYHILIRCTGGSVTHYVNGLLDKTQALSGDTAINSTVQHGFGTRGGSGAGDEFDGYLAQYALFDGTAYTYDQVTETINGILVPKDLSALSYGTNGFLLDFADDSAVGTDAVGSNDMDTVSGFVASDVVTDSPTNNFATFNPLDISGTTLTYSEGNLKAERTSSSFAQAYSSFSFDSGKWYAEFLLDTGNSGVGVIAGTTNPGSNRYMGQDSYTYGYYFDGRKVNNASYTSYGDSYTTAADGSGDVVGVYIDADNGDIYFSKNGTVQNSGTAAFTGVTGPFRFAIASESNCFHIANFGQDDSFAGLKTSGSAAASDDNGNGVFYDAIGLSGYLAPCTANLTEPAIGPNSDTTSDEHFNTVLYTGDGTNGQAITGVGHQPDLLWIKSRSGTAYHELHDSVRGAGTRLFSNDTAAESTVGTVSSFDSDGFTVSRNSAYDGTNQNTVSFVGWSWKAGGTAVSNTNGSITSSVSANQDAGFSIVSYTGTGANATIGHGLASAPEMLIIKTRDSADNWPVYHAYNTSQPETDRLLLSTSDATFDNATMFNDTAPTSSVFSVGTNVSTNKSGDNFICYAFHSVEGHLKCGSYAGNGSTDGTFVYTGFRPAFVLLKVSSAVNNWFIYDNKREGYNQDNDTLSPNLTTVEDNSYKLDLVSNGFKIRGSNNAHNQSGQTFIYLAFAEAPFKYANAR